MTRKWRSKQKDTEDDLFKTSLTWIKHQLIHILGEDQFPSREKICGLRGKPINQQQAVIDVPVKLSDQYEFQENIQNEELSSEEIETINQEF